MIEVDTQDIRRLERDLQRFASRAFPFATRNTVNQAAFKAQRIARETVREDMILRNRWTEQSIQVDKARTLNVSRQAAVAGSVASYLETQEFGGVKVRKGKEGTPIATSYSAGQGESARPRTRLPRKPNRLQNIRLKNQRIRHKNRKQRNLVAVRQAAQTGSKYVFLDLHKRKGIFQVTGGKRNPRVKMVWDLSRASVRIPRSPWLAPSVRKTEAFIPEIHRQSLEFQLKRHNLFRPR